MSENSGKLGKQIAAYSVAPAYLQHALFISLLSLLFFLGMMAAFYIRQSTGYFLLASAFLVIYLVMFISWVFHRRTSLNLHESGLSYKNRHILWNEIESIKDGRINIRAGRPIVIPAAISESSELLAAVQYRLTRGQDAFFEASHPPKTASARRVKER